MQRHYPNIEDKREEIISSMEKNSELYGKQYRDITGYKLVLGDSQYGHKFGGHDWKLPNCDNCAGEYQQLIVLDLKEPGLNAIINSEATQLPLISCLNCSSWWEYQCFKIDFLKKEISLLDAYDEFHECLPDDCKFPGVFQERKLQLTELTLEKKPIDEEQYYDLIDSLGEASICRVLGRPLFVTEYIEPVCPICSSKMNFIAQIAPTPPENTTTLDGVDFYFGEGVLYYYYCDECKTMQVFTQQT